MCVQGRSGLLQKACCKQRALAMSAAPLALVLGTLLLVHGAAASAMPSPATDPICGDLEVVDLNMLGVTTFDAAQFTPQDPTAGLCILGTDEADTIFGTGFDDIILGFKGKREGERLARFSFARPG